MCNTLPIRWSQGEKCLFLRDVCVLVLKHVQTHLWFHLDVTYVTYCPFHKGSSIISVVLLIQSSHTEGRVTHNLRLASSASQSPLQLNLSLYTSVSVLTRSVCVCVSWFLSTYRHTVFSFRRHVCHVLSVLYNCTSH
jgi:hypothetical protein